MEDLGIVALIDFCLLVNLLLTVTAIALILRPDDVVRFAVRQLGFDGFFEEEGSGRSALAVARLWSRWLWILLFGWGLLTGFLLGLHWNGFFWAHSVSM